MRLRIALVSGALALATAVVAQNPPPPPPPPAAPPAARDVTTVSINGKKVAIDYGRVGLKGRSLDDLIKQLPDDRIWRAGNNEVTTFTSEVDLMIGTKKVPAGKYSLYVHAPASGDWSLVLNTDPGTALINLWAQAPPNRAQLLWPRLDGYTKNVADKEVVRAAMKGGQTKEPVDPFSITLTQAPYGAVLFMAWGDKSWSIDLKPAK